LTVIVSHSSNAKGGAYAAIVQPRRWPSNAFAKCMGRTIGLFTQFRLGLSMSGNDRVASGPRRVLICWLQIDLPQSLIASQRPVFSKLTEATIWWNHYWPMPWFGPLFMILAVAFCAAMMFVMMRGMMGHRRSQSPEDHYELQIIKERYARGEISKAEYEERRQVLQG
jgi:uncharacterized membrane protein